MISKGFYFEWIKEKVLLHVNQISGPAFSSQSFFLPLFPVLFCLLSFPRFLLFFGLFALLCLLFLFCICPFFSFLKFFAFYRVSWGMGHYKYYSKANLRLDEFTWKIRRENLDIIHPTGKKYYTCNHVNFRVFQTAYSTGLVLSGTLG